MMWWSYLFRTSLLCFSFSAWMLLTLAGYLLLRYHHRNQVTLLAGILLVSLWCISTFNVWYEGIIHLQRISLLSSFNSWAFVALTPLVYLYLRLRFAGCWPRRVVWVRHLLLPVLLGIFYIVMAISSSVPDQLLYRWSELLPRLDTWWGVFRLSCYVLMGVQLCVYLPRLLKGRWSTSSSFYREVSLFSLFGLMALLCLCIPLLLFHLLYVFALSGLAFHLLKQASIYRFIKLRLNHPFVYIPRTLPQAVVPAPSFALETVSDDLVSIVAEEPIATVGAEVSPAPFILFTPEEEVKLDTVVRSSLYQSRLTVQMLALEMGTNRSYLTRYFKEQRETTFSDYLSACRLEEAARLLLETDETVVAISELLGYQSLSNFYTVFVAHYKIPPAQWRKRVEALHPRAVSSSSIE